MCELFEAGNTKYFIEVRGYFIRVKAKLCMKVEWLEINKTCCEQAYKIANPNHH